MQGIDFPHLDYTNVRGAKIQRLLVDNMSSCGVIFLKAFFKIGIDIENLKPYSRHLVGFKGHESPIMSVVILPLTIGSARWWHPR